MTEQEKINGWTFEETVKIAENLMEVEKNMFKWDVLRHLRDFAENFKEELKQYRAIGTPEECRSAVEKQKEVRPKEIKNIYPSGQYECPICRYCVGKHKYFKITPFGETLANCKMEFNYCPNCGQKIYWSDEE